MRTIRLAQLTVGIASGTDDDFPPQGLDAALCPHTADTLRYEDELSGRSARIAMLAERSAGVDYPLLCGMTTSLGHTRAQSVFTFYGGKIADIADRIHSSPREGYVCGESVHVLRLRRATVGLLVDTDVLSPALWRKLLPHASVMLSLARGSADEDYAHVADISMRYGTPYVVSFDGGDLLWGTPPAGR